MHVRKNKEKPRVLSVSRYIGSNLVGIVEFVGKESHTACTRRKRALFTSRGTVLWEAVGLSFVGRWSGTQKLVHSTSKDLPKSTTRPNKWPLFQIAQT